MLKVIEEEKILCGIYKITSLKERIYVGQSEDIERRKREYSKLDNCDGQIKLYRSLKKYGWENHKFEIIHLCKEDELNDLEMYYIKLFDSFNTPHGLNLTEGGGGMSGYKQSEETKQKKSKSLKGRTWKDLHGIEKAKEMKKDLRESKLGKHHKEETLEKMKQSHLGKMLGKDNPRYGVEVLDSTIEKLKKANTGKNNPRYGVEVLSETRDKISKTLTGITLKDRFGIEKANEISRKLSQIKLGKTFPNGYKKKKQINKYELSKI